MQTFAEKLKALRLTRGLGQEDVSQGTGISRSSISMYENGQREPTFDTLFQLARFYGVHPWMLFPDAEDSADVLATISDEHRAVLNAWETADPACRRIALDLLLHFKSDVR